MTFKKATLEYLEAVENHKNDLLAEIQIKQRVELSRRKVHATRQEMYYIEKEEIEGHMVNVAL